MLDRRDRLEKQILLTLRKFPYQYYNAFQNLARNTRFIYLHAYQSYVWNEAVSRRLEKFGRKVLVGDLVIKKEQAHLIDNIVEDHSAEIEDEGEVDDIDLNQKTDHKELVIEVTDENISEFELSDVVMPMIGHDVRLPSHQGLQQIFVDIMQKDGVSLNHFQNLAKVAATSASGSYRKIIASPS